MKTTSSFLCRFNILSLAPLVALLLAGCQPALQPCASQPAPATAAATTATPPPVTPATVSAPPEVAPATNQASLPIRIRAGATEPFTDSSGNRWLPDQGFTEGDTVERPDLAITNTADPQIYRTEHYSMTGFTQPLPNGKYLVKLHFCETYEGITGPGQRVFSFNVAGHEFKDFDVWVKAGGPQRAYIETVPVEITDGKLEITFTPNIENPQINGIEIIPSSQ